MVLGKPSPVPIHKYNIPVTFLHTVGLKTTLKLPYRLPGYRHKMIKLSQELRLHLTEESFDKEGLHEKLKVSVLCVGSDKVQELLLPLTYINIIFKKRI
jgi:hypothetical protein